MTRRSLSSRTVFPNSEHTPKPEHSQTVTVFPIPLGKGTQSTVSGGDHGVPKQPSGTQSPINVRGNSKDPNRGTWCTPKAVAEAIGPFDLDPFSNPRSHIASTHTCMLERQDDGLGGPTDSGQYWTAKDGFGFTDANTRVFLQPPYGIVLNAFNHYAHTRWTALLRFDPRPEWWHRIYNASELVAVLVVEFEPPPGVSSNGGNSFPHALYYKRAEDVTPAVLRMAAAVWRKKPQS